MVLISSSRIWRVVFFSHLLRGCHWLYRSLFLKRCHVCLLSASEVDRVGIRACSCFLGEEVDRKKERLKVLISITQASAFVWNTTQGMTMLFQPHDGPSVPFAHVSCSRVSSQLVLYSSRSDSFSTHKYARNKGALMPFPLREPNTPWTRTISNRELCYLGVLHIWLTWAPGLGIPQSIGPGQVLCNRELLQEDFCHIPRSWRNWFQKQSSPCCETRDRCHFSTPLHPVLSYHQKPPLPQRHV